jgi:hypothetical protein
MRRYSASILVTLALAQASLSAQAPTPRDSAGVRISQNPARQSFAVNLRLGRTPLFDVGGLHDDKPSEEFNANQSSVRGVRLSDGGLVAIDVNRVKYFDAAGRLLKVAGRDGDGPGEFRQLYAICRTRGDTIVVADGARLGVLDKHGTFVKHLPSPPGDLPLDGCFDDGTILLAKIEYRVPTQSTSTTHLWRVSITGSSVVSLGDVVGSGFDPLISAPISWLATGRRIVVGDGTRKDIPIYQLPALAPIGGMATSRAGASPMRLVASIRSTDHPEAVSTTEIARLAGFSVPNNASAADRAAIVNRMTTMPHLATWPTSGRIYADPDANLWVADYPRTQQAPTGYSKFDANGRLIGRLVIPVATKREDRIEVIGFGRNNILVSRWDKDGALHLTVYGIIPGR